MSDDCTPQSKTGDHTPRVRRSSGIAALNYECESCGEVSTTPRGFSDSCGGAE